MQAANKFWKNRGIALAMMLSLFCISAQATFVDEREIIHTDAVALMVELGIMDGKDDGSFSPAVPVTRAEMAKMLSITANGGVIITANTPLENSAHPSFSDVSGHWATSHIQYCVGAGLIAGRGDGTFDPDAPVSKLEAAKMMLGILRYDVKAEGFLGEDWAAKVETCAKEKGLFKELEDLENSAPLSRDAAAQLVANGVQANMVYYDYELATSGGDLLNVAVRKECTPAKTILTEHFNRQPQV